MTTQITDDAAELAGKMREMPPHVEKIMNDLLGYMFTKIPIGPAGLTRQEACALFSALCIGAFSALWSDCDYEQWSELMAASRHLVDKGFERTIEMRKFEPHRKSPQ
jgi:hypothetical protein